MITDFNETYSVSDMPQGASWIGALNMAGNVMEWVSDWYHPGYYKISPPNNPRGPETGYEKVLRGGAWFTPALAMRVALRNLSLPYAIEETIGFRCAIDAPVAAAVNK